ncbi:hypothetical protein CEXT_34491 [Caerostris extrusa]|uniref:Uncharacterized protein n=1 Tax=Caerostris extrusa TaxID=172846 RepID=A0AAV4TYS4_CAEEX|nr:hypothetical protein CEXT_34491 [Caerostris extrusa]
MNTEIELFFSGNKQDVVKHGVSFNSSRNLPAIQAPPTLSSRSTRFRVQNLAGIAPLQKRLRRSFTATETLPFVKWDRNCVIMYTTLRAAPET